MRFKVGDKVRIKRREYRAWRDKDDDDYDPPPKWTIGIVIEVDYPIYDEIPIHIAKYHKFKDSPTDQIAYLIDRQNFLDNFWIGEEFLEHCDVYSAL